MPTTAADQSSGLELLRTYFRNGSQDAFSELVRRHVDVVYSAALRQVRDPHLAEDVTQAVFLLLLRHGRRFTSGTVLNVWLLRAARFASLNALKLARRRTHHEQLAGKLKMKNDSRDSDPPDDDVLALLDQGIDRLPKADRTALVLRFFEGRSVREVAGVLGTSENAATKRISRAIDKLRGYFGGKGVTVTASSLSASLAAHAVKPASFSAAAAAGASASGAASAAAQQIAGEAFFRGLIYMAASTKLKTGAVAAIVLLLGLAASVTVFTVVRNDPDSAAKTSVRVGPASATAGLPLELADVVTGTYPDNQKIRELGEIIRVPSFDRRHGGREVATFIGWINTGHWIQFARMNFDDGSARKFFLLSSMEERYKTDVIVRIDAVNGPEIARVTVQPTREGGIPHWQSTTLTRQVTGVHDLYLTFKGGGVNLWSFKLD